MCRSLELKFSCSRRYLITVCVLFLTQFFWIDDDALPSLTQNTNYTRYFVFQESPWYFCLRESLILGCLNMLQDVENNDGHRCCIQRCSSEYHRCSISFSARKHKISWLFQHHVGKWKRKLCLCPVVFIILKGASSVISLCI